MEIINLTTGIIIWSGNYMSDTLGDKKRLPLQIDFDLLMDFRVDYAFKLAFSKGDTRPLISLLNAIFANKEISRIIKSIDAA